MSVLANSGGGFVAAGGINTGDIANSVRFRASNSAYLSKTLASPTDGKKFTFSCWVKRGELGVTRYLIGAGITGNGGMTFEVDNAIRMYVGGSSTTTSAVFRDPSAHLHILGAYDSTQAANNDRIKIYINGIQQSASANATISLNYVSPDFGAAVAHCIGSYPTGTTSLDGYLSRICFVDGQALTPSSFGELNTTTNEWVSKTQSAVKAVVDAGGTNSFMLDFDDATSLTTLGYDKSSKGNNWTLNNISLTAGVTYDHMLDVPGNSYATWQPLVAKYQGVGGTSTFSDGNLLATFPDAAADDYAIGTMVLPKSGKWYWECTPTVLATVYSVVGVIDPSTDAGSRKCYWYLSNTGNKSKDISASTAYGNTFAANDVIGVAVDFDNGKIFFSKNGTWQNSGDPVAGTNAAFTDLISSPPSLGYTPHAYSYYGNKTALNCGQRPFA